MFVLHSSLVSWLCHICPPHPTPQLLLLAWCGPALPRDLSVSWCFFLQGRGIACKKVCLSLTRYPGGRRSQGQISGSGMTSGSSWDGSSHRSAISSLGVGVSSGVSLNNCKMVTAALGSRSRSRACLVLCFFFQLERELFFSLKPCS